MVKRPRRVLHSLYAKRRARPTSPADGPGFIYAFIDKGSRFKIGMTRNFDRRRTQWDRQCPSNRRRWMPPLAVQRRRRADPELDALIAIKITTRSSLSTPKGRRHGGLSCILCFSKLPGCKNMPPTHLHEAQRYMKDTYYSTYVRRTDFRREESLSSAAHCTNRSTLLDAENGQGKRYDTAPLYVLVAREEEHKEPPTPRSEGELWKLLSWWSENQGLRVMLSSLVTQGMISTPPRNNIVDGIRRHRDLPVWVPVLREQHEVIIKVDSGAKTIGYGDTLPKCSPPKVIGNHLQRWIKLKFGENFGTANMISHGIWGDELWSDEQKMLDRIRWFMKLTNPHAPSPMSNMQNIPNHLQICHELAQTFITGSSIRALLLKVSLEMQIQPELGLKARQWNRTMIRSAHHRQNLNPSNSRNKAKKSNAEGNESISGPTGLSKADIAEKRYAKELDEGKFNPEKMARFPKPSYENTPHARYLHAQHLEPRSSHQILQLLYQDSSPVLGSTLLTNLESLHTFTARLPWEVVLAL
ncbi:hypothetical protein C8R42DRAFT_645842 [Lentinula raphanica]|nr:hypothetical protein C8R42DRAFT_645842 [Lentinula raphanica]